VTEHPVSQETLEAWLPDGELIARNATVTLGEPDVEGTQEHVGTVQVRVSHGEDVLLATAFSFAAALDSKTYDRRQFVFSVPSIQTRDGMHAIVQVGLLEPDKFLGDGSTAGGTVYVDALVVAGEGDDEFRVVELDTRPEALPDTNERFSSLRMLLGLAHPGGDPPEGGLLIQVRSGITLTWRKQDNGASGAGIMEGALRTSSKSYSYGVELQTRTETGGGKLSASRTWNRTYTWNGRVW
jgi:hypothetical protein